MGKKILWVVAALMLVAIPAVVGLVALRGDDGSSSASRRAGALIAAGTAGHELQIEGLLPAGDDRLIDVESWSWGVAQSGTAYSSSTGGAAAGKVSFHDLNFTKKVDAASPNLFLHCSKGTILPKVVLTSRKASDRAQEYIVITLEQVLISSVQLGGTGAGGEPPTEQVALNFAKATVSTPSSDREDEKGAGVIQSYDLRTAKAG